MDVESFLEIIEEEASSGSWPRAPLSKQFAQGFSTIVSSTDLNPLDYLKLIMKYNPSIGAEILAEIKKTNPKQTKEITWLENAIVLM